MSDKRIEGEAFDKLDCANGKLPAKEFDECTFTNCDLKSVDLGYVSFLDCEFVNCDLSNAKINNTAFKEVKFSQCKLLGLHFGQSNPFLLSLGFEQCVLNLSSFYSLKLKGIEFDECSAKEVDFAGADLSESTFKDCDLLGALFENTNLQSADFRTSYNYDIDPETNRIKKAKFSKERLSGLLSKYDIVIE